MSAISIIIPVYNAQEYLSKCLKGILNQTFANWEAICINDGSADNSYKILKEYAKKDPRFKIIDHKKNIGVSAARNEGIKNATGQYILFLDADDYLDSDYLDKMFGEIMHTDADMACSGFITNTKHSKGIEYKKQIVLKRLPDKIIKTRALTYGYVWRYLFKKSFINKNKLFFDQALISQEDALFVLQALKLSGKLVIVPNTNYHYVLNPNSALNNRDKAHHIKIKENYKVGKKYRQQFAQDNGLIWLWRLRKLRNLF